MRLTLLVLFCVAALTMQPAVATPPTGKWVAFEEIKINGMEIESPPPHYEWLDPDGDLRPDGTEHWTSFVLGSFGSVHASGWMASYANESVDEDPSIVVIVTRGFKWEDDDPHHPATPTGLTFSVEFDARKSDGGNAQVMAATLSHMAFADAWGTAKAIMDGNPWQAGQNGTFALASYRGADAPPATQPTNSGKLTIAGSITVEGWPPTITPKTNAQWEWQDRPQGQTFREISGNEAGAQPHPATGILTLNLAAIEPNKRPRKVFGKLELNAEVCIKAQCPNGSHGPSGNYHHWGAAHTNIAADFEFSKD